MSNNKSNRMDIWHLNQEFLFSKFRQLATDIMKLTDATMSNETMVLMPDMTEHEVQPSAKFLEASQGIKRTIATLLTHACDLIDELSPDTIGNVVEIVDTCFPFVEDALLTRRIHDGDIQESVSNVIPFPKLYLVE